MIKLSTNINKLATLRNARGKNNPHILKMTEDILTWGAHGITIHPRPDERHIRRLDVFEISSLLEQINDQRARQTHNQSKSQSTDRSNDQRKNHHKSCNKGHQLVEFNIEGYPSPEFLSLVMEIEPTQCTLVPDPPHVLTSNAGWELDKSKHLLKGVISKLKTKSIRSSLFINPMNWNPRETKALQELAPSRVELYTEHFAEGFAEGWKKNLTENFDNHLCGSILEDDTNLKNHATLEAYKNLAHLAKDLNIGVNAGHDLNQKNLGFLIEAIPWIEEVSIGHALVCEALYDGMETTIKNYLKILHKNRKTSQCIASSAPRSKSFHGGLNRKSSNGNSKNKSLHGRLF